MGLNCKIKPMIELGYDYKSNLNFRNNKQHGLA